MNIGIIGLGKMGEAVAYRCIQSGHTVWGYDRDAEACKQAEKIGVTIKKSIADLTKEIHYFWIFVPAGDPVDAVLKELHPHLGSGDIIIDGGNSFYKNSMDRAKRLADDDVFYLDCGTSGGVRGRAEGFCLMVGGEYTAYSTMHPVLEAVAASGGVAHVGRSGAGHYVKMVHNGIEYGILQAYAEGFHVLKEGEFKDTLLDLEEISRIWNVSSVIRSYILELAHDIFVEDQALKNISGKVDATGMGKWTVQEGNAQNIPVEVIEKALRVRDLSRETGGNYATKVVAMLRKKFGGHKVTKVQE